MQFSYDKTGQNGIAIVRSDDDELDGNILCLSELKEDSCRINTGFEIMEADFKNALKVFKPRHRSMIISKLQTMLENGEEMQESAPEDLKDLWKEIKLEATLKKDKIVLSLGSTFEILPTTDEKKREIYYIAGCSGSGKSFCTQMIAKNYQRMYPKRNIYLFSAVKNDPTLKAKNCRFQVLDLETLEDDPLDYTELKNSLCVFDDVDTIRGKLGKTINQLISQIANMGRHECISMIVISHQLNDYFRTRDIIAESSHIVIFPQSTNFNQLQYLLKNSCGMIDTDIRNLKRLGRWVCIHKQYPQYLLSETRATLMI